MLSAVGVSCATHKNVASSHKRGHSAAVVHKKEEWNREGLKHVSNCRKNIVEESLTWLGTPYRYGGAEKGVGTDCSGLVLRVYEAESDIKLPRNSAKQGEFCKEIKRDKVQPGDLVFFAIGQDPTRISHVGIMLDADSFIHASSKKGVTINRVSSPYYTQHFIMYGKVPGLK